MCADRILFGALTVIFLLRSPVAHSEQKGLEESTNVTTRFRKKMLDFDLQHDPAVRAELEKMATKLPKDPNRKVQIICNIAYSTYIAKLHSFESLSEAYLVDRGAELSLLENRIAPVPTRKPSQKTLTFGKIHLDQLVRNACENTKVTFARAVGRAPYKFVVNPLYYYNVKAGTREYEGNPDRRKRIKEEFRHLYYQNECFCLVVPPLPDIPELRESLTRHHTEDSEETTKPGEEIHR